jgi:DNA-binding XRE family transcriptional regulator
VTYMNLNLEKERDLILEKIKIKKIRDNLGFSRTKLAQIIGISDKSIYRWEHEVNIKPHHDSALRISKLKELEEKLLDTFTREDAKKWLNTPKLQEKYICKNKIG